MEKPERELLPDARGEEERRGGGRRRRFMGK
jgi:hypothetical protein